MSEMYIWALLRLYLTLSIYLYTSSLLNSSFILL